MSANVHEKQRMTVTIAKKKKVTFMVHEQAEIDVNRMDDIGRVIDTITYTGEIVGRDQFGKELRVRAKTGGVLSFKLDNISNIRQGDKMKGNV